MNQVREVIQYVGQNSEVDITEHWHTNATTMSLSWDHHTISNDYCEVDEMTYGMSAACQTIYYRRYHSTKLDCWCLYNWSTLLILSALALEDDVSTMLKLRWTTVDKDIWLFSLISRCWEEPGRCHQPKVSPMLNLSRTTTFPEGSVVCLEHNYQNVLLILTFLLRLKCYTFRY